MSNNVSAQEQNSSNRIQVQPTKQNTNIDLGNSTLHYSNLSKQWAISDKIVNNEDYSSKYYANQAKNSMNNIKDEIITISETSKSNIEEQEKNSIDNINKIKDSVMVELDATLSDGIEILEKTSNNVMKTKEEIEENILKIENLIEDTYGMPIGTRYSIDCSSDYIPFGSLPCDGTEYSKTQFNNFWDNYLTSDELERYEQDWTQPFDIGFKLRDCIYVNGLYVAVGDFGEIATSNDGVAWNIVYQRDDEYSLNSITYGNGLFVAVGEENKVVTSNDSINWTEQILEISESKVFNDIIYANGLFVAVGKSNVLITSNDGINWTVSTIAVAGSSANFKSIVYGNGLFAIASLSSNILTSTDCVNWTEQEQSNMILKFNDIIYANGLFVAVDNNGNIRTSTDCINWTNRFTYKYYFTTLAYGNGLFVACSGTYAQIATSTDGINWENTEHVSFGSKVSYCKDKFIFGGSNSAIIKMCSNKPKALLNTCFIASINLT